MIFGAKRSQPGLKLFLSATTTVVYNGQRLVENKERVRGNNFPEYQTTKKKIHHG
jgi:hypothetical protein